MFCFEAKGKLKTSQSRTRDQQTKDTYDIDPGILTLDTLVGGEIPQQCANPTPLSVPPSCFFYGRCISAPPHKLLLIQKQHFFPAV